MAQDAKARMTARPIKSRCNPECICAFIDYAALKD